MVRRDWDWPERMIFAWVCLIWLRDGCFGKEGKMSLILLENLDIDIEERCLCQWKWFLKE